MQTGSGFRESDCAEDLELPYDSGGTGQSPGSGCPESPPSEKRNYSIVKRMTMPLAACESWAVGLGKRQIIA